MKHSAVVLALALAPACALGEGPDTTSSNDFPSFEEFEAATFHEEHEGGVYVVDFDHPIVDIKALEEYWAMLYSDGALILHRPGGQDAKWSATQKKQLTYCVSNNFGANKNAVVTAMNQATAGWEQAADVDYQHVTAQDASCSSSNQNVLFDVSPTNSGGQYLARAFFPGNPRSARNILVDNSAFGNTGAVTLTGIMRHELGHTLGFRHEHIRPEAGNSSQNCMESNDWRELTSYDSASVMHYPQCRGTNQGDLVITTKDAQGAAALYGAPGGGGGGDPPPPPPPPPGGTKTQTWRGNLAYWQEQRVAQVAVTAGTNFRLTMTGTGDPDVYVRFGAWPNFWQFHCRPYLDGPNEQCDLDVPAGQTAAYIMVHGYSYTSSYEITATWTGP